MVERRRARYWFSLILPLILAAVLMVGCDATDQEGGGGGLGDETPLVDSTPLVGDEGLDDGLDDGAVDDGLDDTPEVVITDTEEMTETTETEPTEVITATTEPTAEATPEDAADDTGDDTGDLDTQTMGNFVIRAGELVGMSLVDDAGEQMAIVDELLVDESGAVKYVIVESLAIGDGAVDDDLTTDDDATTDDTADDAATDDTLQDDPAVGPANTVALSWDSINVVSGTVGADADDGAPGDGEISLVYSGDTALAEQTAFDATMLDEEGSILDDQAVGDEDVTIPSEFADLIQLGEFGDFNLTNSEGDDLGEIEDVLIDVNAGQVAYAIVDVGGFLGIGEKQVAIPWQAFQIDVTVEDDAEEESFMLDATEDELENAPGLDLDDWNPEVETDWDADLRGYWEATDMNMGTDSETDTETDTDTDTDTESGTDS